MRSDNTLKNEQCNNGHINKPTLLGRHIALSDKIRSRRKQRGFDLIQLGLVVALIGLLMAGAMVGVPKIVENIKTNQQGDDLRTYIAQSQAHFALFEPAEIGVKLADDAKLFPAVATVASDTEVKYPSRFGGDVTATYKATGRELTLKIDQFPSPAACTKLGSQLAGVATTMKIGEDAITTNGGRLSMKSLSESCVKDANKTITITTSI